MQHAQPTCVVLQLETMENEGEQISTAYLVSTTLILTAERSSFLMAYTHIIDSSVPES